MKKLLAVAIVAGTLALIGPAPLQQPDAAVIAQAECVVPPEQCEKAADNVGFGDWLFGNHKAPTLHFIDFLELFLR